MQYANPAVQAMIISETLQTMGYYVENHDNGARLIKIINDDTAYCFQVDHDKGWEFELLAFCKQTPEFLGTYEDNVYKKVLEMALELDRNNVRSEAYEQGREDMRWEAQSDFEQAYWEYLDGAESDFDPSIYGQRED